MTVEEQIGGIERRVEAGAPDREPGSRDGQRPVRVAILNTHPIQYFAPLYAYLNAASDLEITALYCTDLRLRARGDSGFGRPVMWDVDLLAGYESVFLSTRSRTPRGFLSLIAPDVWKILGSGRFDVLIVHGHRFAVDWLAVLAARRFGVTVMMRGDGRPGLERDRWRRVAKRVVLRALYRVCDGFLAVSTANRQYYHALGVPAEKIFLMPYAVDNDRFTRGADLSEAERARKRAALGIPGDRPVVLYASKFTPRKNPHHLVRAAGELAARGVEFTLLMVGDGVMRGALEGLVRELGLRNVVFPGFVNQARLPEMYGISDVFVLPSENEAFGLVVNEAMCAGLPIVISDGVGCAPDLLHHGENGFCFPVGDIVALADVLERLLTDAALRKSMGVRSRERIASWSFEQCLQGLRAALAARLPGIRGARPGDGIAKGVPPVRAVAS